MVSYCLSLLSAQSVMVGSTIAIHNSAWCLGTTSLPRSVGDFGRKNDWTKLVHPGLETSFLEDHPTYSK